MLGESGESAESPQQSFTQETSVDEPLIKEEIVEVDETPLPPPRRKSSVSTIPFIDSLDVPLARSETVSVASTQDLNDRFLPEPVNDLSSETVHQPAFHAQIDSNVMNIWPIERETIEVIASHPEPTVISSSLQITPEVLQEIIEKVRETLPIQPPEPKQSARVVEEEKLPPVPSPPQIVDQVETQKITSTPQQQPTEDIVDAEKTEEVPRRPPSPIDYTPTSEIPASFYNLRSPSEDESLQSPIPPSGAVQRHRSRKHRRCSSSESEECHRRHHHHTHHHRGNKILLFLAESK